MSHPVKHVRMAKYRTYFCRRCYSTVERGDRYVKLFDPAGDELISLFHVACVDPKEGCCSDCRSQIAAAHKLLFADAK